MITLKGKAKGQGTVEYALIVVFVAIVILLIIPLIISGVGQAINTVGNSLDLQTPPTVPITPIAPPTSPSNRNFITIIVTVFATMGIPAGVSFITSFYDGAIREPPGHLAAGKIQVQRDNQGRCIKCKAVESFGRLSAKLCLGGISFAVWGITNASQKRVDLRPDIGTDQFVVILFFLILINITFHYMCSKRISDKHMELRVFLVFLSMLIPVCTFYNLTV